MSNASAPVWQPQTCQPKLVHVAYAAAAHASKGSPAVINTCTERTAHATVLFYGGLGRVN